MNGFAPLRRVAFRETWGVQYISNVGGWMQSTGAAWEMTSLTSEPLYVALLAAAGTLPMFLFCFLAGILADRFERKRYIIVCQFWMMGVAATLAVLAFRGQLTAWNLLLYPGTPELPLDGIGQFLWRHRSVSLSSAGFTPLSTDHGNEAARGV